MGCKLKLNSPKTPILFKIPKKSPKFGSKTLTFCSTSSDLYSQNQELPIISTTIKTKTQIPKSDFFSISTVNFKTLEACKLGISRYPDFEYNAQGGNGTGSAKIEEFQSNDNSETGKVISVFFNVDTLYIPPLMSKTTKFLGLPLPPFLKIDIVPEFFQGNINTESGKVDLEFKAKFLFSIGSIYKAPPLLVKTMLTSEESEGKMRRGRGERLDKEGKCRLVGVSSVEPINDFLLNSFLSLPTECIANLNAIISLS